MDLQIRRHVVKPVGEQWVLVHKLRISTPILLLLNFVVDVGYGADVTGISNKVDKLPGPAELKLVEAFAV